MYFHKVSKMCFTCDEDMGLPGDTATPAGLSKMTVSALPEERLPREEPDWLRELVLHQSTLSEEL